VACLAEDPPRLAPHGEPTDLLPVDGMFDASSLSPHHDFILASVPGAASYISPSESFGNLAQAQHVRFAIDGDDSGGDFGRGAGDAAVSGDAEEYVDGYGGGGVGDPREFQQGQELISRIVYFCEDSNLEAAFELHIALRDRLMRGGVARVPITLPPLVLATLRVCARAGVAVADLSLPQGLLLARRCMHFVAETIDALKSAAPETALRLNLQSSMTAAVVYRRTANVAAASSDDETAVEADNVQQYVYENMSRAFEMFESGIVSGKAQFAALELIVGALGNVGPALDADVYDALAARTVKHAQRLLTRSDQCLALCASSGLFWTSSAPDGGEGVEESDGRRSVGSVLVCMNAALQAARGCVNDGERVLLLVDVGNRLVRLHEMGCTAAGSDGRLDEVLQLCRKILDERRAKSSIVGRAAAMRLTRLRKHIKSHPSAFVPLALKYA
jgi:hypothetical protein